MPPNPCATKALQGTHRDPVPPCKQAAPLEAQRIGIVRGVAQEGVGECACMVNATAGQHVLRCAHLWDTHGKLSTTSCADQKLIKTTAGKDTRSRNLL